MSTQPSEASAADWCPPGWVRGSFAHGEHEHAFYVSDEGGAPRPSVLLMHEFPGISDHLVKLGDRLAKDFRVVVPSIFGRDGTPSAMNSVRQLCVRREVHILAADGVSRSVDWLRDLVDEHVAEGPGRPYGVVGMCFTGNFALALAVDPRVRAAVVAQPALPILPRRLGLSARDRDRLSEREDLEVQGYRFREDRMSPAAKLVVAQDLLGSSRMRVFPLDEPDPKKHSTLTGDDRSPEAIEAVRTFLLRRLAV